MGSYTLLFKQALTHQLILHLLGKYLSHVSMRERSVRLCSGESSQPTVWLNDALDPGDTMAKVIHCHIDMTGQSSHTYHLVESKA